MTINLQMPDIKELRPRITVFGVGGAGGNAVNNMIETGLMGVDFVVANTDAQALTGSRCDRLIQMGVAVTEGLGAGSQPEVGAAAAEEVIDEINDHLSGAHMVFITAGMGGGTGTGAAPVIAAAARQMGILTVGVVTKPFHFEGQRRMRVADAGLAELQKSVDTLIVIPNQNLFRIANEKTTFADAFAMADQVLYSGVACITDLMVKEGLINLDFADVRSIMRGMGKAMMGTGEASGDKRALQAAEAAIANPLLDEVSMRGARGLLISITGGKDLTLFEVDEAATRIREEVDPEANIILGATFDDSLEGVIRVSVVATGIDLEAREDITPAEMRMAQLTERLKTVSVAPSLAANPAASAPVARGPAPASVEARAAIERELAIPVPTQAAEDPGVTIEPYMPDAAACAGPEPEDDVVAAPIAEVPVEAPRAFIPPTPQMPERTAIRMPPIEEFPLVAQREIKHAEASHDDGQDERGPIGLLRRLAHVGLGRREDGHEASEPTVERREPMARPQAPRVEPAAPAAQAPAHTRADQAPAPQQRPMARPPMQERVPAAEARPAQPTQPAPRPASQGQDPQYKPRQGDLDPHGRAVPRRPLTEDDQLEIPAFLRRQAN